MEKRKVLGTIIGVLAFIALIAGISFAWFSWQSSNNTLVSFTVEGVDITFDAGADITSSKLRPVSTKEVGVSKGYAIKKTITASARNNSVIKGDTGKKKKKNARPTVFFATLINGGLIACNILCLLPTF